MQQILIPLTGAVAGGGTAMLMSGNVPVAIGTATHEAATMTVSGRGVILILLAASGFGLLFALASSPDIPDPGRGNIMSSEVVIVNLADRPD